MRRVRHAAGAVLIVCLLAVMLASPGEADASSARVAALQAALKYRGLYPVAVDGVKGPFTTRGVRRFQRRRNLLVDGIAGPQTKRALAEPARSARACCSRGNRGWDVAALQFLLSSAASRRVASTACSGPAPGSAVINFQSSNGLGVGRRGGAGHDLGAARPLATPRPPRSRSGTCASTGRSQDRSATASAPRARAAARHAGLDFPVGYGTRVGAAGSAPPSSPAGTTAATATSS